MVDRPQSASLASRPPVSAFDHAPTPLLVCDEDGIVRHANRSATRLLASEDVAGTPLDRWLARPCDLDSARARSRGWLAIPAVGRPTSVVVTESILEEGGGRLRILNLSVDARTRPEKGEDHAQDPVQNETRRHPEAARPAAEQRLDTLARLTAAIAHDANNALSVILGISELLLATAHLDATPRRDLEHIRHAGERAALLTRQMLDLAGPARSEPETDLNEVLLRAVALVRPVLGAHIELRTDLAADLCAVRIEPAVVRLLLVHLLIAAHDAIEDAGRIEVRTADASLAPGRARGALVEVRDIPQRSHCDPIVRPARRGGALASVVHDIVRRSGGTVETRSDPDAGTVVRIRLPSASGTA